MQAELSEQHSSPSSHSCRRGLVPAVLVCIAGLCLPAVGQGTAAVTIEGADVGLMWLSVSPVGGAFIGNTTLQLPPGTYTLAISRGPVYGTFTVAADLSVGAPTGPLVVTPSGPSSAVVGFDLAALAGVNVMGAVVGNLFLQLGEGSTGFPDDRTFYLPAGSYPLVISRSSLSYGTVTVASDLSVSADGSLTLTPAAGGMTDVGFDLTTLADVTIEGGSVGPLFLDLSPGSGSILGDGSFFLPSGSFSVAVSRTVNVYGSFTVTGTEVTAAGGALSATSTGAGATAISIEPCLTERVVLTPSAGEVLSLIGSTAIAAEQLLFLPAGTYVVNFTNPAASATFSVGPAGLSDTALPASGPTRVSLGLVPCNAQVTIKGNEPGSLFLRVNPGGPVLLGDQTLDLGPGTWDIGVGLSGSTYGSVTVGNDLSVTASGALQAIATGPTSADIHFDASMLAEVTFHAGTVGALFLQLEPAASTGFLDDTTFLLPAGTFDVNLAGAGSSFGAISVAPGLSVTASGSLVVTQTGPLAFEIDFDTMQLAEVTLKAATVGPLVLQLVPASTGILGDRSFFLPEGGYSVQFVASGLSYGTFAVGSDLSVTATAPLVATATAPGASDVDFDLGALAGVTVKGGTVGPMLLWLVPGFQSFSGDVSFALPEGSFSLGLFKGQSYGTIDVGADLLVSTTGTLVASPTGVLSVDIDVDPCLANQVDVAPASGEVVHIGPSQPISSASQLVLPSGTYLVAFSNPVAQASFSVGAAGLSATALPSAADPRLTLGLVLCPSNSPPVADAGPDQLEVPVEQGCAALVTLDGSGSSDPDSDALSYAWSGDFGTATGVAPSVELQLGSHTVSLVVSDGLETAEDEVVIEIVDLTAPSLIGVPDPVVVECADASGTSVTLPAPTAVDDCDGPVPVTSNAPSHFPLGATLVTFAAVDAAGNEATAVTLVTVVDTTPPTIDSLTATPHSLWPAHHKFVEVEFALLASDACSPTAVLAINATLSSDEPDDAQGGGDGKTTGDVHGADGFSAPVDISGSFSFDPATGCWQVTVDLRAERAGNGDGRTYQLEGSVLDSEGNAQPFCTYVFVPHSQADTHACDDHQCDLHDCTTACPNFQP